MAQRMQELKDVAEFRKRHLQRVMDWADPVKRAVIKEEYAKRESEDRLKLKDIPAELVSVRSFSPQLNLRLITRPLGEVKPTRWKRFKTWISALIPK